MKRKLGAMCLMFNPPECWVHFALHSAGHKEEGVGAGLGILLQVCFTGSDLRLRGSEAWRPGKVEMDRRKQDHDWKQLSWFLGQRCSQYSRHLSSTERQRLQREGLPHGAQFPITFSNHNYFCGRSLEWTSNAIFSPSQFPREMLTHLISFQFQRLKNCICLCDVDAVSSSWLM